MKKNDIFKAIAILFLSGSCHHPADNTAVIKGNLTGATGFKLVLQEMDTREIHSIDSIVIGQNGGFNFSPVIRETGFWLVKTPTGKILVLMLNAGDQVELTGKALDFPDNVILKGPQETLVLHEFFQQTRVNEHHVDSLEMLLVTRQDSSDYYQVTQKLDTSFRKIWENQRNLEIGFIDHHPESLASLVVLNYAFGMSPVLSPYEDFVFYKKLDSLLFLKYPDNKHVKFHHQRMMEIKHNASDPAVHRQTQHM